MRKDVIRGCWVALMISIVLSLASCSPERIDIADFAARGIVIDSSSNRPLEGATVVMEWWIPTYGAELCLHSESGRTNANGEFELYPRGYTGNEFFHYAGNSRPYGRLIIYKPGFSVVSHVLNAKKKNGRFGMYSVANELRHWKGSVSAQEPNDWTYSTRAYRGSPEEHIEMMSFVIRNTYCVGGQGRNNSGNLVPFYQLAYGETSSDLEKIVKNGSLRKDYEPGQFYDQYKRAKITGIEAFRDMVHRVKENIEFAKEGENVPPYKEEESRVGPWFLFVVAPLLTLGLGVVVVLNRLAETGSANRTFPHRRFVIYAPLLLWAAMVVLYAASDLLYWKHYSVLWQAAYHGWSLAILLYTFRVASRSIDRFYRRTL